MKLSRDERRARRVVEMAVSQLPTYQRKHVRVVLYALQYQGISVKGCKSYLDRAQAVLSKAVNAINILEGYIQ